MRPLVLVLAAICRAFAADDAVFTPDSHWEVVSKGHRIVEGIAAARDGTVYLTDVPDGELFKLAPGGKEVLLDGGTDKANGLAIAADGRLFAACMGKPALAYWNLETGTRGGIPLPSPANDLAITPQGWIYCTWGAANAVYQLDPADPKPVMVAGLPNPNGITLSQDGGELWVGEFFGDTVRAFAILADGRLGPSRAAFKARVPADGKGLLDGMTPLADGRLLVATALGLQVLSAGAEPLVLPNPTSHRANYVRLITDPAGLRWIYAAHEKSVLRRRTRL